MTSRSACTLPFLWLRKHTSSPSRLGTFARASARRADMATFKEVPGFVSSRWMVTLREVHVGPPESKHIAEAHPGLKGDQDDRGKVDIPLTSAFAPPLPLQRRRAMAPACSTVVGNLSLRSRREGWRLTGLSRRSFQSIALLSRRRRHSSSRLTVESALLLVGSSVPPRRDGAAIRARRKPSTSSK